MANSFQFFTYVDELIFIDVHRFQFQRQNVFYETKSPISLQTEHQILLNNKT